MTFTLRGGCAVGAEAGLDEAVFACVRLAGIGTDAFPAGAAEALGLSVTGLEAEPCAALPADLFFAA